MKFETIDIGKWKIGEKYAPFIVAEMSGNHNQSLDRAIKIIEAAAQAGAHAIKLQTYTADTLTLNSNKEDFQINDPQSLWAGKTLHELYKEAYTPWEWHEPLIRRCKELEIFCFSTPFDETAVDFLEELNMPMYKIASFELTHIPLLKKIARTKKPIVMSTGMATEQEIAEAITAIKSENNNKIIILKCTSTYPASPENTNISTIPDMRERFQVPVGLSDHTMGIGVAVASVAYGAVLIEKHFTLRRSDAGVDSAFSMEPQELKQLRIETERAWLAKGKIFYGPTEKEKKSLAFRRSIYFSKNLPAGTILTEDCIRIVRPGYGLAPKEFSKLLGRKLKTAVNLGTAASWDLIE